MDSNGILFAEGKAAGPQIEFVDLGLPSGTLWSIKNIGATNGNTAESWYGNYYAWGEIETKEIYDWDNYKYANGNYDKLTKYCNNSNYGNNGFTDDLTQLVPEDDVATQTNSAWRMPTKEDFEELIAGTTNSWVTDYKGISGLGEDGASIQPVYRYVDPSHVGILDLDASSASDPGMSGMICPMAKLYGPDKSFSEYEEPNTWRDMYKQYNDQYHSNAKQAISFDREQPAYDYMSKREQIVQEELDINRIRCPVTNINDPTILYTCSQAQINQTKDDKPKSLFTIREDN